MATSLQQQLAVIATNSTHQLDLKAQKVRHSKSLLFEPRDAASQSFDTIYQICFEAYEELCMLDARFRPFARNLFSPQSKYEDRTQMTAKENEELDKTVASFLGLVGGRLLLKPAVKAVEWLVRRFRVQEYNTEIVLLTFLPYHTSHVFATVLSIIPDRLPASFRWLNPYVASLQCPPRHAVVSAAINNAGFFSTFSQYVLGVANARHQSAVLLGFWASIAAQSVNGMVDSTRSGRDAVRKQHEEDLLLRILPILQSALSIRGVPELYLGSCMIMTILATKASLEDKVLDAMMEAVASAWTQETISDGLTCLAVLAEEKTHVSLPKSVSLAILKTDGAVSSIARLADDHRTDKLLIGVIIRAFDAAAAIDTPETYDTAKRLLQVGHLSEEHLTFLVETLLRKITYKSDSGSATRYIDQIQPLLCELAQDPVAAPLLQSRAQQKGLDMSQLTLGQVVDLPASKLIEAPQTLDPMDVDQPAAPETENLGPLLAALPELDGEHPSFLEEANMQAFKQHLAAFSGAAATNFNLSRFLKLQSLQKTKAAESPTFLTFLARVWSSRVEAAARVQALELATAELQALSKSVVLDMQELLPYAIGALGDEAHSVRRVAAQLCQAIRKAFGPTDSKDSIKEGVRSWCAHKIYGARSGKLHSLSAQDSLKFTNHVVIPILEDCVLDGAYVVKALAAAINGKDLKQSLRSNVSTYLASHASGTPALKVKLRLLDVLNSLGKVASDARKAVLLDFVKDWIAVPPDQLTDELVLESLTLHEVDKKVLGSLSHRSVDEIQLLESIAVGKAGSKHDVSSLAFERLRELWPMMKTPSQDALADFLLGLAVEGAETDATESAESDALETLRNLSYSPEVLAHLVETLPDASDLQDRPSSAKRQRTSKTESPSSRKADTTKLNVAVRRITLVLELLETSKPEQHPQLLKSLFHLLSELHHYKGMLGSQLVYVQGLLMGCLLSTVNGLKSSPASNVDRSVIRADLIVECVRTTSSTQVHNTALLLMGSLATWAPELVLHSVMPLFTFMSTTLLRQSDEYSAHVTDRTVARIVPPLAESLKKRGNDLVSGAAELLLSFTAAFEHIPLHRRLTLFQHLVQTLGPEESLFAVVAMLAERYSTDTRLLPFIDDLMGSFSVATQFRAFKKYLGLVFDALSPKRDLSDIILGFSEKDAEQAEDSINSLLEAFADILQNPTLRRRVAKDFAKGGVVAEDLRTIYAQLLDQTMQLGRDLASIENLRGTADSVLSSLLGLTPATDFIESSAQLMQTGSDATRQQVFYSLEARVAQARRGNAALQQTFLEVLPNCCAFISDSQPAAVRHAAITCIDQIAEKYGKRDRAAVAEAAESVASNSALGSKDASLRVISILCLASMVEVLGDEFVSIFPRVLSMTLDYLEKTLLTPHPDNHLCNAAMGLTCAVLDHLPWMLSAGYLDRTIRLAANAVAALESVEGDSNAISEFCALSARKVGAQELLSSVDRTWENVTDLGAKATQQHLAVLHIAIQQHTKAIVTRHASVLFSVLLKAFDLRRKTIKEQDVYSEVYTFVDRIAMDVTLKLNDATFRPFFIRFVEWATTALPKKGNEGRFLRSISLFKFTHLLFEQLKSIVTSYASYLLENSANLLRNLAGKTASERELLVALLQTLSSSFRHDQDDFWQAPAHFDGIALPLLSQLENAQTVPVTHEIIPTITELAAAAVSPEHHKAMNTAIMQYMRHRDAAVRLAAVQCERAITDKLNFDWLALLPEMLPVISELQEDDDEEVERETLRWVRQIEEVTGESLEGMLQ